eukprot:Gb_38701 [translate_table: standard]
MSFLLSYLLWVECLCFSPIPFVPFVRCLFNLLLTLCVGCCPFFSSLCPLSSSSWCNVALEDSSWVVRPCVVFPVPLLVVALPLLPCRLLPCPSAVVLPLRLLFFPYECLSLCSPRRGVPFCGLCVPGAPLELARAPSALCFALTGLWLVEEVVGFVKLYFGDAFQPHFQTLSLFTHALGE